jgi:hypothetical protein
MEEVEKSKGKRQKLKGEFEVHLYLLPFTFCL